MSRFLYWTIVLGTEPTSFRASDAEELLPTLTQLRRKHPDASLRWFQRGRLWISPDEAKAALSRERSDAKGRPATWRPGGTHVDPRQKYIDGKKAKWTRFKSAIRERAEARRDARGDRDERPRPERPPLDRPRDDRTPIKPDAAAPPADRPPRRDWRTTTERGDAPRLVRQPLRRKPEPSAPEAPVQRDERPFDRERKPPVDRERKPPFDRAGNPAFDREGKPAFDRDRKPAFDRERRPPFDRERKPAFERERKPPFDRDRKPPFDRERKPAFERERKPPFDRDRKPGGDREGTRPPGNRPLADWRPKTGGEGRPAGPRPGGDRPRGDWGGGRPEGERRGPGGPGFGGPRSGGPGFGGKGFGGPRPRRKGPGGSGRGPGTVGRPGGRPPGGPPRGPRKPKP
jgi:hypothetical protein